LRDAYNDGAGGAGFHNNAHVSVLRGDLNEVPEEVAGDKDPRHQHHDRRTERRAGLPVEGSGVAVQAQFVVSADILTTVGKNDVHSLQVSREDTRPKQVNELVLVATAFHQQLARRGTFVRQSAVDYVTRLQRLVVEEGGEPLTA
jgi:hypothetical protein